MDVAALLPRFPGLRKTSVSLTGSVVSVDLVSTARRSACPKCGVRSRRVHSRYDRSLRDLPWAESLVILNLTVRRFRCDNASCLRSVFAERLEGVVRPHGRRTRRAEDVLAQLALEMSSEAGSRTAKHFGLSVSAPTLRRLLRRMPTAVHPPPRVIGVDDWAFRKGHSYGTMIVDLERHRVLDLLPDRTADSLATWLKERPSIEIISRDRASCYADGAAVGAPQARQVADRWHLLKNLGDAVQRLFERHPAALRLVATELAQEQAGTESLTMVPASGTPAEAPMAMSPRQAERLRQFETAKALHLSGQSRISIARHLNLSHVTVRRYIAAAELPQRGGATAPSSVTPFLPYIRERWAAGCQNGQQLWLELQGLGYSGSYSSVCRALKHFRGGDGRRLRYQPQALPRLKPLTPRKAAWLFTARADALSDLQREQRNAICRACPDADHMRPLVEQFTAMVRDQRADLLDAWLVAAVTGRPPEISRFAAGLKRDYEAVRAAVELPWSNGQLEGQVNRLKLIKRLMYGRARFDLLRLRVLAAG